VRPVVLRRQREANHAQHRIAHGVEADDRPAQGNVEEVQRPRDPQGGAFRPLQGYPLRGQFSQHDMERRDDRERDRDGNRMSRGRSKSTDDGVQQRLDHASERGLADPAKRQGCDGDAELARGDVRIQVPDELAGQLCGHVAFRGKLLDSRPPRRDECKLRGDEEAVGDDQQRHREQANGRRRASIPASYLADGNRGHLGPPPPSIGGLFWSSPGCSRGVGASARLPSVPPGLS
jgi:hypothetical protein